MKWEFGPGGTSREYEVDFHILKNAPADVDNDSFLFDTKALSVYDCFFTDDNDEDEDTYFFAIDCDKRHQQHGNGIPRATLLMKPD